MLQRRPGTESQSCVGSLRSGHLRVYWSKAGFCSNGGVKGGLRGWKAKPSKHEIKALGPLPGGLGLGLTPREAVSGSAWDSARRNYGGNRQAIFLSFLGLSFLIC